MTHLWKVCHRYRVETAAECLGMGRMWPEAKRRETLARVRSLPTYERASDTVEVCRYVPCSRATECPICRGKCKQPGSHYR